MITIVNKHPVKTVLTILKYIGILILSIILLFADSFLYSLYAYYEYISETHHWVRWLLMTLWIYIIVRLFLNYWNGETN